MRIFVILHDIRSAHNVGSIFRTADGAGAAKVFLCGYTPDPRDRFGRPNEEIMKTSLGATESVPWEHYDSIRTCIESLKRNGVRIVGVEQHARAISYARATYGTDDDVAFIFGNEVEGVPDDVIESTDTVVAIPMYGKKESLNVSVSVGVILFNYIEKAH